MTRRKWSRAEKIAVTITSIIVVVGLLVVWAVWDALVGHWERTDVWSCSVCLKDKPEMCGVFESSDAVPALSQESARISALSKLAQKIEDADPNRDPNVTNYLADRVTVTCSSRREWVQVGGWLGAVH